MADINFRQHVLGLIKPTLPVKWKFSPTALIDEPKQTSVELMLQRIELDPEFKGVNNSHRLATYTLNIVTPGLSDDVLDDALIDVLSALDDVPNLRWTGAERGTWGLIPGEPSNPCYTISLTYPFIKEES